MSKISLKIGKKSKIRLAAVVALAGFFLILPLFTFSGKTAKLYVDDDATGTQDGSAAHPYKKINQAIQAAKGKTEIHVANGTYKENLDVEDDVEIYGENRDKVIIKAKDDGDATVVLDDDTKINKVTIKEGKNGIWVKKNSKTSIIDCLIKDNRHDGIAIESDGTKDSKMVSISDNIIKNNGWTGIYSGKRRLSITENEIRDNGKDGIDIAKGSRVWIAENKIRANKGSGLKLAIDGSDVWIKKNDSRLNKREGLEVSFAGAAGRINISKSKFVDNGRYGVAKLQRGWSNAGLWANYLTIEDNNDFWGNPFGNISRIIHAN